LPFGEAVVVFLVGMGKGDTVGIALGFQGKVNEFTAIIIGNAQEGEGFYDLFLGFIEEGTEFEPPGTDIGGVQDEVGPLSANSPAFRYPL
jgi:hypothetical protein